MVVKKRKRVTRFRGSRTHGWGRLHRGSGNRGGAGYAGTGKKAHVKKQWRWDAPFGKSGFKMKGPTSACAVIGLRHLEQMVPRLIAEKVASQEGGVVKVDLGKIGIGKLLGSGKALLKLHIHVDAASEGAIAKVKEAGGEVHVKHHEPA